MLNTPKSWATLIILSGSLKTEEVSEQLNIEPDFFQEPEFKSDGSVAESGIWQINSLLEPEESLEEQLWNIIKRIAPGRLELTKFIQPPIQAVFYCSTEFIQHDISNLKLSSRLLLLIGGIGADLEISSWEYDETDHE